MITCRRFALGFALCLALTHCKAAGPVSPQQPSHGRPQLSGILSGGLVSLGARAVVLSGSDRGGCTLYGTDGTRDGTRPLTELAAGNGSCSESDDAVSFHPIVVDHEAYFLWGGGAFPGADRPLKPGPAGTLWRTDGTPAGSHTRGAPNAWTGLAPFGERVLLLGQTVAGTSALVAYVPATDSFEPLAAVGSVASGAAAFTGTWSIGSRRFVGVEADAPSVWETDGTASGTKRFVDVPQLTHGGVALGNRLAFLGSAREGTGLWVTDGTAAGTRLVEAASDDGKTFTYAEDLFATGASVLYARNVKAAGAPDALEVVALAEGRETLLSGTAGVAASGALTWPPRARGVFGGWLGPHGGQALFLWQNANGQTELRDTGGSTIARLPVTGWAAGGLVETGSRFVFATTAPAATPAEARYLVVASDGSQLLVTHSELPIAKVGANVVLFDGSSLWTSDGTVSGTSLFSTLFMQSPLAVAGL